MPCEPRKSTAGSNTKNRRRTVPPGAAGWLALCEDVARPAIVPSKLQGTTVAVTPLRGFGGFSMKFRGGLAAAAAAAMLAWALPAQAQGGYFGQNKVQYRSFKFQVLKTQHFDIYYYPEEEGAARMAGRMAERWY